MADSSVEKPPVVPETEEKHEATPADSTRPESAETEEITKQETRASRMSRSSVGRSAMPADDEDIEYPGPLKLTLIMVAICMAIFLVALDQTSKLAPARF